MHQPLYCSADPVASPNHCGPASAYVANLLEYYFLKYNVDLVVTGHVHNYERFLPMNSSVPWTNSTNNSSFTSPPYPIYVACGAVGNNEGLGGAYSVGILPGSVTNFGSTNGISGAKGPGSTLCEFATNSTALQFNATVTFGIGGTATGTVFDNFTISKP